MIEQWQIYLNCHQRMGILPMKKRVNNDKCSFATKQSLLSMRSFAIEEAPSPLPGLYATLASSGKLENIWKFTGVKDLTIPCLV